MNGIKFTIKSPALPKNQAITRLFSFGAPERDRTADLRVTNALLYQLSHGSI